MRELRLLLFGKNGQVGWELHRTLSPLGKLIAVDYPEIDFTDDKSLRTFVRDTQPHIIINAAAYTQVDRAESEPDLAMKINGTAPAILAEEALQCGACLIHYSTDYVYDGRKGEPYVETDSPNPLSVYGMSKLMGDQAIEQAGGKYLILRTSWVYSTRVGGFVNKVLKWAREHKRLRIVDDQIGNPTWARMLAEVTAQMIAMGRDDPLAWLAERSGLYHLAGAGHASRLEWARSIVQFAPDKTSFVLEVIEPAKTDEFPTPAKRPLFSAMDCSLFENTFEIMLPEWQHSLELALSL